MAARRLPKTTASEQPRCFGYCRVSTEGQADSGIGLDEQRRKIEARAAEMNWRMAGQPSSFNIARKRDGRLLEQSPASNHPAIGACDMAARRLPKTTASEQPRCFGYCRVSTEGQADSGIGLDEQRRKIEARAAEMNWRLEHVYTDTGVSGSTPLGKRSEGARLLAALRPGDIVVAARVHASEISS